MLSSSVIKNVDQASHYYGEKDNYYTKDEGMEQSEWWGKGADHFNLAGAIDENQFTQLLQGKLPTGQQLGKVVDGEIKHRAGWDLTFSAPKSVSLMAFVAGDKRLINAHRDAVSAALSHIEYGFAQARIKRDGNMEYQNSKNMLAALFHHDLSRAKDPQLHTHSVVFNMTKRADGEWRSMASQLGSYGEDKTGEINGFIERVRHHNRYLSKLYEGELAFRVKQLGYEIRTNTESGIFEIEGISQEAIDHFSKRRAQIEKAVSEKGFSGGKAHAMATLDTRIDKEKVDRQVLQEQWENDAEKLGFNYREMVEKAKLNEAAKLHAKETTNTKEIDNSILSLVDAASRLLSVFKTTFTYEELIAESIQHAIRGEVSVHALLDTIDQQINNGHLLSLQNKNGKTLLMSKSTLEDEKQLIHLLKNNDLRKQIISDNHLNNFLTQHEEIHSDMHGYLKEVFNHDRVVLIEGEHSKNSLLDPLVKTIKSAHLDMAILSPNQIGSKKLAKALKPEANTIWQKMKELFVDSTPEHYSVMQFLNKFEDSRKHPDVLIVDNAHLLSTHQKARLVEWNTKHETKLILLGDKDKLLPLQQGSSIQVFAENGINFISIPKVQQENNNNLFAQSIKKISNHLIEISNHEDRHHIMAKQFSFLNSKERNHSWLIGRNKEVNETLNNLVHENLKKIGELGQTLEVSMLIPSYLSKDKAKVVSSYQAGQIVQFNQHLSSLKIQCGEYLKIKFINKANNQLFLEKNDGRLILWQPDKIGFNQVELFDEKKKEISVGERIVFHRSINNLKIAKGERFTVLDVKANKVQLANEHRKSVILDLSKPYYTHFDYGYAANLHAIAHEKPIHLIAELPAKSFATDQRRINQIANQSPNVSVYTDNLQSFTNTIGKRTGDKENAIEIFENAKKLKAHLHAIYEAVENEIGKQHIGNNVIKKSIEAVDYAIRHLSEREAGFKHKDLIETALKYAIGEVNHSTLSPVIKAMQDQNLLHIGQRNDGTLWTTAEAVKLEREILALCNQDKNKFEPIISQDVLASFLSTTHLKPEQAEAITNITQNRDRILPIQGHAGTGKTTMMMALDDVLTSKDLLREHGYELLCIAPTNKAVKELVGRDIKALTIDSFLLEMRKADRNNAHDWSKTVLVIDEASMVSNKKMLQTLSIVHEKNFRQVVPTGDTKQNPAIEAGRPFDLIQTHLYEKTNYLTDIQRQKNKVLQDAVKAIYQDQYKEAFTILDSHSLITEINEKNRSLKKGEPKDPYHQRINAIVKEYFHLLEKGEEVQLIAPSHKDRKAVNQVVREELAQTNKIKGEELTCQILSSVDMTEVERSKVKNFKNGQIVRFSISQGKEFKAGSYFSISGVDVKSNILFLTKEDEKKSYIWQVPHQNNNVIEVFKKEKRGLKVGDKIIWTRTNKKEGVLTTDFAHVQSIEKADVLIKRQNGELFTFNSMNQSHQHWDHGYAVTVYNAQGGTYSSVLALFESSRKKLMNIKTFLVTVTRAVNHLRIYTDYKDNLINRIVKNKGDKASSLEIIGEFPKIKSKPNQKIKSQPLQEKSKSSHIESNKSNLSQNKNQIKFDRFTIEKIKEGLNRDAEKIAINILGEPKLRGSHFLKFGSNQGSLSVTIKGEKQGWWNDFSDSGGRNMLSFLQKYAGYSKAEALDFGAKWLSILPPTDNQKKQNSLGFKEKTEPPNIKNETENDKKRIHFAVKLAEQSQPIKGTLAEKYLKDHRGINLEDYPADVRFHPGIYSKLNGKTLPALVVIARDHKGDIKAAQATYLDSQTAKKVNAKEVQVVKQTFGILKGASVNIERQTGAPTLIAEGTETGLSLALALPKTNVKIILGQANFKHIDSKSLSETTIFCLDNDGKSIKESKIISESAKNLLDKNKQVTFMIPSTISQAKQDYNDILKQQGVEQIRKDFANQLTYQALFGNDAHQKILSKLPEIHSEKSSLKTIKENHLPTFVTDNFIQKFANDLTNKERNIHHSALDKLNIGEQYRVKPLTKNKDFEHEI